MIKILIMYLFGIKILQEKFNFRGISNLDVEMGSGPFFKIRIRSDQKTRIRNPGINRTVRTRRFFFNEISVFIL